MKGIMNYISEFVCQIPGKKDTTDGKSWIQKKILDNRYYGKKQNKLHGKQPVTNHLSIITGLTKNDNRSRVHLSVSRFEPELQPVRRLQKYRDRVRQDFADRCGALDVDLQDDVTAAVDGVVDLAPGDAVEVTVDLGPLDQIVGVDHLLEPRPRDENVVHTVTLVGSHGPRGRGDREVPGCPGLPQPRQERVFTHPRRAGEHEQHPSISWGGSLCGQVRSRP